MTLLSIRKQSLRLKQIVFIFVSCNHLIPLRPSGKCKNTDKTAKNKGYPPFINIIFQTQAFVKIYLIQIQRFNKFSIN